MLRQKIPEDSEEKVSYASRFYHWFLESFKSCLLFLVALPGVIDNCAVASLKVPAMIVYDVAMKVRDTESFPQHNITCLISGITFIVFLSQEKPLRWKEINTHKL